MEKETVRVEFPLGEITTIGMSVGMGIIPKPEKEEHDAMVGREWANILGMTKDQEHRWFLTTGNKTDLGLYRTICRMVDEAREREQDVPKQLFRISQAPKVEPHTHLIPGELREKKSGMRRGLKEKRL